MRNVITPALLSTLVLFASACSQPSTPVSPSAAIVPAADSAQLAAKAGKLDVCHRTGNGFNLISISDNAWPAHQDHGDGLPLGLVPGSGASFDSACIAISAPAILSASPASVDFGSVAVGTSSGVRVITVKNTGGSPATHLGGVIITPNTTTDYVVTSNTCTPQAAGILDPNETCEVAIRFAPTSAGSRAATFTISTETTGPVTVALNGIGTVPLALSLFPSSLVFSSQASGTLSAPQSILVVNSSTEAVSISSIALAGANAAEFDVTNTCGASILAGSFCNASVVFHPASPGAKTATVNVVTTGGVQQVPLSATGS